MYALTETAEAAPGQWQPVSNKEDYSVSRSVTEYSYIGMDSEALKVAGPATTGKSRQCLVAINLNALNVAPSYVLTTDSLLLNLL